MEKKTMFQLLESVKYRNWMLRAWEDSTRAGAPYLQWAFMRRDVKTGHMCWQHGRKWYLSLHMTESELVLTAFKAAVTCEEHECRENFTYCGKRILSPHISVRALLEICEREEVREEPI